MDKNRLNLRNVAAIVACLAVTVIFASCKKDNPEPQPAAVFLLEELQYEGSNNLRYVYEYDDNDRLVKCSAHTTDAQSQWVHTFSYDTNGDVVEHKWEDPKNVALSGKITFTKNGNIITSDDGNGYVETIELDAQGLPVKYSRGSYTNTLTWQNGNQIKYDDSDGYSVTYTYDDKKSPMYHCNTPKWFLWYWFDFGWSLNNIKTVTYLDDYGNLATDTINYTYNDDGFPVTRIDGGFINTLIYKKK